MTNGLSICQDWLEHLASSHREGTDPWARAKAIVDDCRPAMDRSAIAALRGKLESQLHALPSIVPAKEISAREWRKAVIEGAIAELAPSDLRPASSEEAALDETPKTVLGPKRRPDGMSWPLMLIISSVICASWIAFAIYSAVDMGQGGRHLTLRDIVPG